MIRLSVNLNKIALLRNARGGNVPSVIEAAHTCIDAGCHGITVHPRPDGRHIRPVDVEELKEMLPVELNVEGYPSPELLELVCGVRPAQCTLVPDPPEALTSNAGWDLRADVGWLRDVLARLRDHGIRTSLFLEPDPELPARARALGADRVELYTEAYARAFGTAKQAATFGPYRETALAAQAAGLGVNAGHDLDLHNLPFLAANLPGLLEVSIGHALVADALRIGLHAAVVAYLLALGRSATSTATG